jgi:hypothetical protein
MDVFMGPADGARLALPDPFDGACMLLPRVPKSEDEPAAYLYRATEGPGGLKLIFVGYTMTFEPYTEYRTRCACCDFEFEHQFVPSSLGFPLPCPTCRLPTCWPVPKK